MASLCPPSSIIGNSLHLASLTFPEFQWEDGKGGGGRPGRNSQEQLWGQSFFPNQWTHTTISFNYFAETKAPSRRERLMIKDGIMSTSM